MSLLDHLLALPLDWPAVWIALALVLGTLGLFMTGFHLGAHTVYLETCKEPLSRMLYLGLPMWFHMDEETSAVVVCGFWSFVFYLTAPVLFRGHVLRFTTSYPRALWEWLSGKYSGDDDDGAAA